MLLLPSRTLHGKIFEMHFLNFLCIFFVLPDCQYCKVLLHFNLDHLEYAITGDMNFMAAFDEQTWRKKTARQCYLRE